MQFISWTVGLIRSDCLSHTHAPFEVQLRARFVFSLCPCTAKVSIKRFPGDLIEAFRDCWNSFFFLLNDVWTLLGASDRPGRMESICWELSIQNKALALKSSKSARSDDTISAVRVWSGDSSYRRTHRTASDSGRPAPTQSKAGAKSINRAKEIQIPKLI